MYTLGFLVLCWHFTRLCPSGPAFTAYSNALNTLETIVAKRQFRFARFFLKKQSWSTETLTPLGYNFAQKSRHRSFKFQRHGRGWMQQKNQSWWHLWHALDWNSTHPKLKVLTTPRQIPSTWTTPASSRLEFSDGTGLAVSCKWKTPASDNTTATTRYKAHHGRFKLTMKERMKEWRNESNESNGGNEGNEGDWENEGIERNE